MKAYLITTAGIFVIVLVAHIARATQESHLLRDPWFVCSSIISAALAVWAVRLMRAMPKPS
jgi:hypothetical protein